MCAIIEKELRSFFTTVYGYAFLAVYFFFLGVLFWMINIGNNSGEFQYVLQYVALLLAFSVPILTMKSFAEESNTRTDQLLFTAPVKVEKIVIGKYLGVMCVYLVAMLGTAIFPLVISEYITATSEMNFPKQYNAIFGLFLLGATYIAIGLFVSSITESTGVVLVSVVLIILGNWLISIFSTRIPSGNKETWLIIASIILILLIVFYLLIKNIIIVGSTGVVLEAILFILYKVKPDFYDNLLEKILNVVLVSKPFDSFIEGTLSVSSVVYYLSVIFVFIFLTIQSIKKKRWN